MICTTLNKIREHHPCEDGWAKLLAGLGKTQSDDEPLRFTDILEINGLGDALWATRSVPEYDKDWRLFSVWCARQVVTYTDDWRVVNALNVVERYSHGTATEEALISARNAASDAARSGADNASRVTGRAVFALLTYVYGSSAAYAMSYACVDIVAARAAFAFLAKEGVPVADALTKRFLEIVS
jgi:hypothetical protein